MAISDREKRFHNKLPDDQRDRAKQDRDRILYSSSFQRLAGITQVISPSERRICHNRLTHSLKVGQVARRLAEYLVSNYKKKEVDSIGGINPDVVEAASLAHDLGHPPFGHAAEIALQECFREILPRSESFEGNAQSFRVVTKLAVRSEDFDGLDLTRATLNALLKYPWSWRNRKKSPKWGVYQEDEMEYNWARRPYSASAKYSRNIEAEIMDTADDISYAVHDLEDFYRAGMVPLDRLLRVDSGNTRLTDDGEEFVSGVFARCKSNLPGPKDQLVMVFTDLLANCWILDPYRGLRGDRAALRAFTSSLIGRYIQSAELRLKTRPGKQLFLPDEYRQEIFMLQQLTWHYMILNPALSIQQKGQKRLIKELFRFFYDAAASGDKTLLPPRGREMMQPLIDGSFRGSEKKFCGRLAADMVSSMTEPEAQNVAHRILGISQGSAFDQFL
jgi:dGTPase